MQLLGRSIGAILKVKGATVHPDSPSQMTFLVFILQIVQTAVNIIISQAFCSIIVLFVFMSSN